ncbi:hypothetical protein B6U98_01685 [Thermoplasmatales archaeon ex4572_165]|nr:MAG: hypothetical protein B6U98_01685 [Thermoplasmatales archaeon ex4572_165]RLF59994.1 MAG: hypothetical protein DRN27_00970 [Thermoplasmata archaeon]
MVNYILFNQKYLHFLIFLLILFFLFPHQVIIHAEISDSDLNQIEIKSNNIIYITGFTPFFNYSVNPSESIVNELNQTMIQNYSIIGRILPVDFIEAPLLIQGDIKNLDPSLIICLGLDSNCDSITLEALSINLKFNVSDNQPLQTFQRLKRGGPFIIPTRLDIKDMFEDLKNNDIPASISFSAGLYVCNAVFYETLFYLTESNIKTPMGFIHVPHLEDYNNNGMKLETMIDGILTIMLTNIQ